MRESNKEIIKIASKEILLSLCDLAVPFFGANRLYRKSVRSYIEDRAYDKQMFRERIKYLKRMGYIEVFLEGKENYIELTAKGLERIDFIKIDEIKIQRSEKWDGLWRVVIFDIPDNKRSERGIFQRKLIKLGFVKIQESIYAYPFECTAEVSIIESALSLDKFVLILISKVMQGEEALINEFLSRGILENADLSKE